MDDFLGQPLEEGDWVVKAWDGHWGQDAFLIAKVIGFTPKMVRIRSIRNKRQITYSENLLKIDPKLVTLHKLKRTE